jgi:hypothetical protein
MKNKNAYTSGMRGSEKPNLRQADDEASAAERELGTESSEQQDSDDLGTTVADHIHTDENGEHHLNLTTLAQGLSAKKSGGIHDK